MKINRFLRAILVIAAFLCNEAIAQNDKPMPLEDFLIILEEDFEVVFTYADENVHGISVSMPSGRLELDEYLTSIEKQTGLTFKKLNSRYIAIQKKPDVSAEVAISGTVVDKKTHGPLEGAVIHSSTKHTLSDNNGWFSIQLDPAEDSILEISYTGYHNLTLLPDEWNKESSVYALTPKILELEEVVVNYIASGINKRLDGAIQMNMPNLEILPGLSEPDVLHTTQVLPGILSVNETVSYLNTRGGTNDQNLVLWEGVKMYQTGHFFGLISGFNSHVIHQTTLIKNGTSAAFDEGVSGTIDMKLQNKPINDFNISSGIDMLSADAIIQVPLNKKLSFQMSARRSINDLIITPTYKSYYKRAFDNTDVFRDYNSNDTLIDDSQSFSFYDISFKLLYDVSDKDKIRLSFLNINNSIEFEENATIGDTVYKKNSSLDQSSVLSAFDYHRHWNDQHTTHLSAYVSSYTLDGVNAEIFDQQSHVQRNEVLDWGIKVNSAYQVSNKISLLNGYQFDEIGIRNQDNINKPDYSRDVKDVLRIQSVYSEATFNRILNRVYFRLGLRGIYLQKFNDFLVEPRAVLNYKLNESMSFEVLAEMKSQYTTQLIDYQTDFLGIEKRRWVLSNDESIPVIKSRQVSAGMQYSRNGFLFSLDAYKKQVDDIISPSQGFQNQFQYVFATGSYDAEGLEALVNKRFKQSNLWVNYSLASNSFFFKEFTPSVFPNNLDIRHALSLGGSYRFRDFELSSGFNYRTGRPYTKPLQEGQTGTTEILYETPNSSRLDDFIRLDVSLRYTFNIKKVKGRIGFSVWNVLNHENVFNRYYYVNDLDEIEEITQHALGITPNVNLRVWF